MTKTKEQLESLLQQASCELEFHQKLYENNGYTEELYEGVRYWAAEIAELERQLEEFENAN